MDTTLSRRKVCYMKEKKKKVSLLIIKVPEVLGTGRVKEE